MAIKEYKVTARKVTPRTGDDIEYEGGHYVLHVRSSGVSVFKEGRYVQLDAGKLELKTGTPRKAWVFNPNLPDTPSQRQGPKKYSVEVHLDGELLHYSLDATSEGNAKNKVAGIIAKKLGVAIPLVQGKLKRPPNKIIVSTAN